MKGPTITKEVQIGDIPGKVDSEGKRKRGGEGEEERCVRLAFELSRGRRRAGRYTPLSYLFSEADETSIWPLLSRIVHRNSATLWSTSGYFSIAPSYHPIYICLSMLGTIAGQIP